MTTNLQSGIEIAEIQLCSIEECMNKQLTRGYCDKHYHNLWRYGNPLSKREVQQRKAGPNQVALTRGHFALVDADDLQRVLTKKWYYQDKGEFGYAYSNGRPMHEFILKKRGEADHKNHNSLDYRKENLRSCTRSENSRNRRAQGGASKFKGVSWNKSRLCWEVTIGFMNKQHWIGYYESEDDAAVVYNVAAQILHGEFAYLNLV